MCEKGKVAEKKCYGLTICIPPFTMLPRGGVRGIRNEVKHGKAGRRDVAPKLSLFSLSKYIFIGNKILAFSLR